MEDQPWTETTATVIACDLIESRPRIAGRIPSLQIPDMPRYAVTFTYQAEGSQYSGRYVVHGESLAIGHAFTICYDPQHPEANSGSEDSLSLHPEVRSWVAGGTVFVLLVIFLITYWYRNH